MKKYYVISLFVLSLLITKAVVALPQKLDIDTVHSSVGFTAVHLVVAKTKGDFSNFNGSITWDSESTKNCQIEGLVHIDSINTKNNKRDTHLKSKDFFYSKKYPKMTLKSSAIKQNKDGTYTLEADLSIRGVTHPIMTPLIVKGPVKGPRGKDRYGFELQFKINRHNYGLSWNKVLENGNIVVGSDVLIDVAIEAISSK